MKNQLASLVLGLSFFACVDNSAKAPKELLISNPTTGTGFLQSWQGRSVFRGSLVEGNADRLVVESDLTPVEPGAFSRLKIMVDVPLGTLYTATGQVASEYKGVVSDGAFLLDNIGTVVAFSAPTSYSEAPFERTDISSGTYYEADPVNRPARTTYYVLNMEMGSIDDEFDMTLTLIPQSAITPGDPIVVDDGAAVELTVAGVTDKVCTDTDNEGISDSVVVGENSSCDTLIGK